MREERIIYSLDMERIRQALPGQFHWNIEYSGRLHEHIVETATTLPALAIPAVYWRRSIGV